MILFAPDSGGLAVAEQCSRRGCQARAGHELWWRNPKLHSVDRTKCWLACDEHLDYLSGYLAQRAFLLEVKKRGNSND